MTTAQLPSWLTAPLTNEVQAYLAHGWSLVPIPPSSKGPRTTGWNLKQNALQSSADLPEGWGIGLAHAYSGTMALDIDALTTATTMLAEYGVDLLALLDAPDAVQIASGRAGRAKLLYRLPVGTALPSKKISAGDQTVYELRCATSNGLTVQDVLPSTAPHPQTGLPYRWAGRGHWTRLPAIPQELLALWQSMLVTESATPPTSPRDAVQADWVEVYSALSAISPSASRDVWIKVGMALHRAGSNAGEIDRAFEMWDTWSAGDPAKYPNEREMVQQWRSFKDDKASAVTLGTLFRLARDAGWEKPAPDVSGLFAGVTGSDAPVEPAALLKPVSVFDVLTKPAPPPAFVWDGYLPRGVVALFGAHGGTGKSTVALMLAVATVSGRPLFGVATNTASAVFVSLEDGANIVRHRLAGICRLWDVDPGTLADRLHIVDGTESPELFSADNRGAGGVTPAYDELTRLVQTTGAGLVVVDNGSDAFGGDEIQRRQVRAFMRALGKVATLTDCSVLLLAHVDKNTSRNKKAEGGEGYSGSTAWHNSARSRLFMTRGENGLLTLEHQKSNLAQRCNPIKLEWPEGGLPGLVNGPDGASVPETEGDKAVALLSLIAEFEGRGQYASPAPHARNNVHALLRMEPAFECLRLSRDATARILNQCQRSGFIESLEYRSPDRKPRERWTVTSKGREVAGLVAPTAPTAPTYDEGAQGAQGAN